MKAQKPPTPPDPTPETPPSAVDKSDTWDDGPNPHLKGDVRRLILRQWAPRDRIEARDILDENIARAHALTSILAEYTWEGPSRVSVSQLREALELVDDLLYLGYSMIEWWDRDEEDQP